MNRSEIINYCKNHPGKKVKLAIADIDGVLRGKYVSTEKFISLLDSELGFCDVVFGWDMADASYTNGKYTGWHSGYPDAPARLVTESFRKIPWENDLPFFLVELAENEIHHAGVCPRNVLKKVAAEAEKMGFHPYFSQEFEWFNFEETPQSCQDKGFQNLKPLTPGMFGYSILRTTLVNDFVTDLFNHLCNFDIPIEGLHTETGPGVYEAAITYSHVMEAADRAVLFKTAVKEIAYHHQIMATFMAKIDENLPGCGGHIHQSLWSAETGKNLFFDENEENTISKTMQNYIAGQLYCLPHILPMIAPTINSFKRLVEGAWAPTTLTWAIDNRTVALRALPASSKSCRLETRVVGADVNPYLAMAACLASGLYGIKHNLGLQEATKGNGYTDLRFGVLPGSLAKATQAMKGSAVAAELFGDTFVEHFTATREWECMKYNQAVTDWEKKRYFEII